MSMAVKRGREDAIPRPLLDRFLRDENSRPLSATVSRREYLATVARDVELLLNTRSPLSLDADDDSPVRDSVTGYGLPDFSHLSPDSSDDLWLLASMVRKTLERFEPRLANIRVEVGECGERRDAELRITADVRHGAGQLEYAMRVGELLSRA